MTRSQWEKSYAIISISRCDLSHQLGYAQYLMQSLTEQEMHTLVHQLANWYVTRDFWEDVHFVVSVILADRKASNAQNT